MRNRENVHSVKLGSFCISEMQNDVVVFVPDDVGPEEGVNCIKRGLVGTQNFSHSQGAVECKAEDCPNGGFIKPVRLEEARAWPRILRSSKPIAFLLGPAERE